MLLAALALSWLCTCSSALPARRALSNTVKLDLTFTADYVLVASIDVGLSQGLSLVIGTGFEFTVLNLGAYDPSPNAPQVTDPQAVDSGMWVVIGRKTEQQWTYEPKSDKILAAKDGTGVGVKNQLFGTIVDNANSKYRFPGDGILGLGDNTKLSLNSFLATLCNDHALAECRFGIALDFRGHGYLPTGYLEDGLIDGQRVTTSVLTGFGWAVIGTVTRPSPAGQTTKSEQTLLPKSENYEIIGNTDQVQEIFDGIGATAYWSILGEYGDQYRLLRGYFPCDDPTPTFSVSFGSDDTPFDLYPSAWTLIRDGNNCTAPIVGRDYGDTMPENTW